ncbi:MAG: AmmeMemoRadiSam system protein A [Phyllobacteriaceae bacterium]|nr:AmmeMemoRadiSam system protein A [Phyllobacteriaceae bacterium]
MTPSPAPTATPVSADLLGATLLVLARGAIAEALGRPTGAAPPLGRSTPRLAEPGAAFVTLTEGGELRGCIGSLAPRRALADDVVANARAAAFDDPRFPPLARDELDRIRVEVSVLSPLEPLPVVSEADALAKIRPGVDGLVLEWGRHRGTFLPQVWDDLPDPRAFLAHLKRKAGLPPDFWADDLRLSRYHVEKWSEPEAGPKAP